MKRLSITILTLLPVATFSFAATPELRIQHRRPSASVLLDNGRTLCVANRHSGTLSLVDITQRNVVEKQIGQQLSDVAVLPGSDRLIVTDFAGGSAIVVKHSSGQLSIEDRIEVSAWPESIAVSELGDLVCVASLWSRRVTILAHKQTDDGQRPAITKLQQVDLPFAPRAIQFVDPLRVVVADSFGGRLVVLDCAVGKIAATHELPVHNIRNMALGKDRRLYLTCQRLNSKGYTTSDDIHWGILMENEVLAISVESLLNTTGEQSLKTERIALGGPGVGAGDPEAVLVTADQLLVTLAGTDELALIDRVGVREARLPTGGRPVSMTRDVPIECSSSIRLPTQ